jgi:hypothetical protein
MKTLVFLFAFLLCLGGIPAGAQNFSSAGHTPQIFERIQSAMRVPEAMKNSSAAERVRVVFTIDENGHAHVVDVNTRRPELRQSVTSQFEAIDFTGTGGPEGETYSIWLNFKVM